ALILGGSYESENTLMNILLKVTRFLDIKSVFIVFGGTLSATLIAYPYQKTLRSLGSVGKVLSADHSELEAEDVFEQARKIGEKRFNGKRLTNEDLNSITNPFMRRWVEGLIVREQVPEEMLESILRSEIEMYEHRADEEIEILDFMSTAAPAFGMVGTIVGLVLMLAETGSVRAVMQSMSIAMLTTLYGVIISHLIIQPLASKRKQLKESNRVLMEMVRESVQCIARRESPYNMLQELSLFLPSKREDFDRQYG
ncbi:MAG: MotA/TolQ/ExbB proton channel family protein, partial [SAR324 cluster bacterium]|nr:MotA/TolQ/ExbB proton channel family protein [SAR324 cluster bacterium]